MESARTAVAIPALISTFEGNMDRASSQAAAQIPMAKASVCGMVRFPDPKTLTAPELKFPHSNDGHGRGGGNSSTTARVAVRASGDASPRTRRLRLLMPHSLGMVWTEWITQ